jgi:hypothetical protein
MAAGLLAQYVVIALAVVASAAYVVRRQWPGTVRRTRGVLALWLLRDVRPSWLRRIGRWIAPVPRAANDSACATPCGGCGPSART